MSNALPFVRRALWLATLGAAAGPALADEQPGPALPQAPAVSVQAYGESNADCLEWTNSCVICRRQGPSPPDVTEIACSTPGVACQPGETICRVLRPKER